MDKSFKLSLSKNLIFGVTGLAIFNIAEFSFIIFSHELIALITFPGLLFLLFYFLQNIVYKIEHDSERIIFYRLFGEKIFYLPLEFYRNEKMIILGPIKVIKAFYNNYSEAVTFLSEGDLFIPDKDTNLKLLKEQNNASIFSISAIIGLVVSFALQFFDSFFSKETEFLKNMDAPLVTILNWLIITLSVYLALYLFYRFILKKDV